MSTMSRVRALAAASAAVAAAIGACAKVKRAGDAEHTIHVVLIGASIGEGWRISEWPRRTHSTRFSAESIPVWEFDKTTAVEDVLMRPRARFQLNRTYLKTFFQPRRQADIAILKECSSYFPGDVAAYERRTQMWVERLRSRRIQVMLATVVPVTKARAARDPGKQETLLEYNRWIREYSRRQQIPVLDLESVLSIEGDGSYLQEGFAAADGAHLNKRAYEALDAVLSRSLTLTGRVSAVGGA